MYAVIKTGGKQYRVSEGDRLDVERLGPGEGTDTELSFTPILVVDGSSVVSATADLTRASVTARVVGETKGPKITGFTYKPKTNQRRRWGHRQHLSVIEITDLGPGGAKQKSRTRARKSADLTATVESEADHVEATADVPIQDEPNQD